jgi:chorismate mutase/heme-degrading monooxygenase HmoA
VILEHVVLPVVPGREADFLTAFREARPIISAMPGFIDLTLQRGIERPHEFLMLVRWETLEAHTEGFRGSPEYLQWKALLHHFYEPFPEVVHFSADPPPVAVSSLEEVRAGIDALDADIIGLLARRQQYVARAGELKRDQESDAVRAPARVEEVVTQVRTRAAAAGLAPEVAEATYRAMIGAFIDLELTVHGG